ncbi:MAG: alpha/beta hydrolase-fold protein [Erysipelotrichaceae bacterium]
MKVVYYKEYSHYLKRFMEFKMFGNQGKPCLVFAPQNGRFYDFENFDMVHVTSEFVESKRLCYICVDSIDEETFSCVKEDPALRILKHEAWVSYIIEELIPSVKEKLNYQGSFMSTGCSMGGMHAMNFFLRYPMIFDAVISLSGIYSASYFFHDYIDELVFKNSPIDYLKSKSDDHPHLALYRQHQIIACVGQGAYEDDMIQSLNKLQEIFENKQIPAWIDYWGYDVNHDWVWWKKQLPYFLSVIFKQPKI